MNLKIFVQYSLIVDKISSSNIIEVFQDKKYKLNKILNKTTFLFIKTNEYQCPTYVNAFMDIFTEV